MINIYILCYNEEAIIKDTIIHHKKLHPLAMITIYDNYSTDNSVKIAKDMGCNVIQWDRGEMVSNLFRRKIKNECWKSCKDGWVIVCDMDEWLCIRDEELENEYKLGTTVLRTVGYDMIAESKCKLLKDIDLQNIMTGSKYSQTKWMAFRPVFDEINFGPGAHGISPTPRNHVVYSNKIYNYKHNDCLGLPFYINKMKSSFERTIEDRKIKLSIHYLNNESDIQSVYNNKLKSIGDLSHIFKEYNYNVIDEVAD